MCCCLVDGGLHCSCICVGVLYCFVGSVKLVCGFGGVRLLVVDVSDIGCMDVRLSVRWV